jgi:hypothetical protein
MRLRGIDGFSSLHAKARAGNLAKEQVEEYRFLLRAFLAAMADVQNAANVEGRRRRRTPRVRRVIQVELAWPGTKLRTTTFDVGLGGLSALLPEPPPPGAEVIVRLKLPQKREVEAVAAVMATQKRRGAFQVSFAFRYQRGDWMPFETWVAEELLAEVAGANRAAPDDALTEWLGQRDAAGRGEVAARRAIAG